MAGPLQGVIDVHVHAAPDVRGFAHKLPFRGVLTTNSGGLPGAAPAASVGKSEFMGKADVRPRKLDMLEAARAAR